MKPLRLLPGDARPEARLLLLGRGLRAFGDGFVSLLLPVYLELLGFDAFHVGILTTATLAGSAALTLLVGFRAHRHGARLLLLGATLLMIATGIGFTLERHFWPLVVIGFIGTLNPSAGDVSLFLPLEQALLADAASAKSRTAIFVAYSLVGSLVAALGSLAAGLPELLAASRAADLLRAVQGMFALYALLGLATYFLYRRLPQGPVPRRGAPVQPLGPSRGFVLTLAALFSLDAFGGGFIVQSLLALWLFQHWGLSLAAAGAFFFWSNLLAAGSYLVATRLAGRIGLVNTMVFTHLPSNLLLILAPFAPSLAGGAGAAAAAQRALQHGRANAHLLRHGGGDAGRARGGGERHRGAAQPRRGGEPDRLGLSPGALLFRLAAHRRRRVEGDLRCATAVAVPPPPPAGRTLGPGVSTRAATPCVNQPCGSLF